MFNANLVTIRLWVLDLELIQVLFINPGLTLTFDPVTFTLIQIEAFINAIVMCKSYQDSSPLLAITDPQKAPFDAYFKLLGRTQTVCSTPETWQIFGARFFWNRTNSRRFFSRDLVTL